VTGWLEGKRALVVGAGSGIGRAVCAAFVAEGARVGAMELDRAKCATLRDDLPGGVVVEGDATVLADDRRAVAAMLDALGGVDILVNCVGVFDFYRGLDDLTDDELPGAFDEIFRVNVASQLLSVKAAADALRESRGSVILTSSTSGFYPGRGGALYVSSKFAVRGLVVALAHELAPLVRVNGVAPGGTLDTDLRGPAAMGLAAERLDDRPDRAEAMRARTPLGIAMTPADHAGSYVFLASDRAAGVTGTFLHPDGGIAVKA
jgi:NAD(P)-dependent dehydrogenase (short-subunit alcohol dehydrogenase family)